MHRSRLATIVIDCPESDADRGFEFWSRALGREALPADSPIYSSLRGRVGGDGGPIVLLQRVPAAERAVHLDIETDDVEAEVRRLEALGATRVTAVKSWWVMRDPAGLPFCVVRVQTGPAFDQLATAWE